MPGIGRGIVVGGLYPKIPSAGFGTEYQAVYDSLTTKPSAVIAAAQNTFVETLVAASLWTIWDQVLMFAQTTNGDSEALKNWINPGTFDASIIANGGALTFTALEGLLGDGDAYINTNWNVSTDSVNYTQNDCGIFVYERTNVQESTSLCGLEDAGDNTRINLFPRTAGGSYSVRVNSQGLLTAANADSRGMWTIIRDAVNNQEVYKNGVSLETDATASNVLPSLEMFILARNDGAGSPGTIANRQVSLYMAGASVTEAEALTITNAFETYMDSNGKGVIS